MPTVHATTIFTGKQKLKLFTLNGGDLKENARG